MRLFLVAVTFLLAACGAGAYPEFQTWIDQQTDRSVNCAMCHSHGDGPDGLKAGQIGSLGPEQLEALNEARQAFKPGTEVKSPILNEFGDRIVGKLGRTGFIELRQRPQDFPQAYGFESDIDADGIADAQEYLDGTLPTSAQHGEPWPLFVHNLKANWWHIALISLAALFGCIGINNLIAGFRLAGEGGSAAGRDSETPSVPGAIR